MTSSSYTAVINLRMKWSAPKMIGAGGSTSCGEDLELSMDQVNAMAEQEKRHYRHGDYLLKHQFLDAVARQKMVDWSYRVCDHFLISREVVATSFSILDRFVDTQHRCDRMTFKLASMTSLYMAAKMMADHHTLLPIGKLVELSRGEFHAVDIIQMETVMLKTLSWRINPPTTNSFVHALMTALMPLSTNLDPVLVSTIYDRAAFFADLSLFDYGYAMKSRAAIAVASILNALEGIGGEDMANLEQSFVQVLQVHTTSLDLSSVEQLREDLWYIYSRSAQYQEDGMHMFPGDVAYGGHSGGMDKRLTSLSGHQDKSAAALHAFAHSPISVLSRKPPLA